MSSTPTTHVIQVTNVAPAATLEQMKELFGFLGRIKNIKLYPENFIVEPQSRVCYVQYHEKWSVGVAQHLTNTVFIDRALIVVPIADEGIPSESTALALTNPTSALPGLVSSGPNALINEICGVDGCLVITTTDPKLTALGLPQYPPLPANMDPVRIEEIRRTVTIGNLDTSASAENLLKFVNQIGEVKFLKMCGDGIQTNKYAFAEFTDQSSVPKALQYNGVAFEGRPMIIAHSTSAIVKPLPKSSETAQKDIDEAMKRVREAQSLITAAIEPELSDKDRRKSHRSRSRSRSRRRSTSRSRHKRKSRSRSRSKRSRSRRRSSRTHRQSRSPTRHTKPKSRSRSRERKKVVSPRHKKERTRSRSRDRKKDVPSSRYRKDRSRSRSPSRGGKKEISSRNLKKERSRSRSRDRSNKQKSKSQSPSKLNSKYRKSKTSKEKEIKTKELERSPRSPKEPKSEVKESSNDIKSRSNYHKGNSQPKELYGPFLPVPETNSSVKEDSKSSYRSNKHPPSRSRSRSPTAVKRNKYRTRSRSLSKESTYSHKNSRSVSKHRSRSRSHKRSRSRSKVPSRKMNSPSRNRRIRDRSRSRSYSPGRQFDRRRKSPKRHSISSRKRSITPKRTSRRRSITPRQRSRSPKHRSRSRSFRRSRSPHRLRTKKSPPRSDRDNSRSPKRHSLSLSPTNNSRSGQRKISDSKEKTPKSSPSFQNEGAKMNCKVTRNYDEEDYNLEKMIQDSKNEKTEFIPFLMETNYNSGYNSVDMDLASD